MRYGAVVSEKHKSLGAVVIWMGKVEHLALKEGDTDWDVVQLVYYPSREKFIEMVTSDWYQVANEDVNGTEKHVIFASSTVIQNHFLSNRGQMLDQQIALPQGVMIASRIGMSMSPAPTDRSGAAGCSAWGPEHARVRPERPDSHKTASGKPGAVHPLPYRYARRCQARGCPEECPFNISLLRTWDLELARRQLLVIAAVCCEHDDFCP